MEKSKTCCFTGHRRLPKEKIKQIIIRLNQEVDNLISQGVTDFISGGALGFDQIAASLIVAKKEMGHDIRLIFALPCRNQDELWSAKQKELYHGLLGEADVIIYVSEDYTDGCMKKRNHYMVNRSGYCICAQLYPASGTAQTVKYARERKLKNINIIK
ncbi:MAG: DUF1273 domain-containing protein [Clostridiales bacterium]|nr:DUF1273 domain-containing protein [Clostridiales bacterium]